MPNAFKDLILRTAGGREARVDMGGQDALGAMAVGGNGELSGTAADLAGIIRDKTIGIGVEPVAIPNPFTGSFWTRYTMPSGLWYAIHAVKRSGAWSGSGSAGHCCAILWRFAPSSSSGTGSVSISVAGTPVLSLSFSAGERFQGGTWWVPDSAFDGAAWPAIAVTVAGSCAWAQVDIPVGALVPDALPVGWDPAPMGPRRGSQCTMGNIFSHDPSTGLSSWISTGITPVSVASLSSGVSPYGRPPVRWDYEQAWDADGFGANVISPPGLPQGYPTDWSRRLLSYPLAPSTEYYVPEVTAGFPLLYVSGGGAFKEALNMPFFEGEPFAPAVPGYMYGAFDHGSQAGRGLVQAVWGHSTTTPAPAISTTRGSATFFPGMDGASLVVNANPSHTAGDTCTVVIYEWTTGTTLYSGTTALTGAAQVVPLTLADPGLDEDAIWEVSATINYNGAVFHVSFAGIELIPRFRPLPWDVPAADGSAIVPGGVRAGQLRDPRDRRAFLSVDATPGATTATATVPTPLPRSAYGWLVRAGFAPASGWYSASASASASPTTAYAYPCGDDDFLPLGVAAIAPAYPGRAHRVLATASLRDYDNPTRGASCTVSISRFTPSPQAVPTDGSWVRLTAVNGAGWCSFTAPADGAYRFDAAYHPGAGDPVAAAKLSPQFCLYAGADADVLTDYVETHAWWRDYLYVSPLFTWNDPSEYPYEGWSAVGDSPTGEWAGHAGELVYRWREWAADAWQYRFFAPPMWTRSFNTGLAWNGKEWAREWPIHTLQMTAGQTVYFRAHGPRGINAMPHGGALDGNCVHLRAVAP